MQLSSIKRFTQIENIHLRIIAVRQKLCGIRVECILHFGAMGPISLNFSKLGRNFLRNGLLTSGIPASPSDQIDHHRECICRRCRPAHQEWCIGIGIGCESHDAFRICARKWCHPSLDVVEWAIRASVHLGLWLLNWLPLWPLHHFHHSLETMVSAVCNNLLSSIGSMTPFSTG